MRARSLVGILVLVLVVGLVPIVLADAPPHVRINDPANGSTVTGTIDINGNAWDDNHVAGVKVRIDMGDWHMATDTSGNDSWWTWTTTWDTTTVPNGLHHIGAIAWDNASQMSDTSIEVYVQNEEPNQPPWVKILTPANKSTVRGVVTVGGVSGDPDANDTVELVQIKIDAGEWQNATPRGDNGSWGHWSYDWNTTMFDDGWHTFGARAFDGDLWSEAWVHEYFVDNEPDANRAPFARILHPESGSTVHGIVLVHGTAGDPDDGDRVELVQVAFDPGADAVEWRDAVDTSHDDSWSTWGYQWDTTKFDNGEHAVCARSFDGDLYSERSCVSVKVANEHHNLPPKVSILHPVNGQTVKGVVLIHGTASDDTGVKLVEVRFNEGDWHDATDTSPDVSWTTWAYEWDTTKRDDGCVLVSARAWDGSLFSEVHAIKVCVDNVNNRPWVKIVRPENGETVHGLYLVHGYSGDDKGVKLVQVRIDEGEWQRATDTGREHPWSTWAFEWDTTKVSNGWHHVCARAWDGEQYSEPVCVTVNVQNEHPRTPEPAPLMPGEATPLVAFGLLTGLGVAILMWLRSHGYIRK